MAKRKKKKPGARKTPSLEEPVPPRRGRRSTICRQAKATGDVPGFLADGDNKITPDILLIDAERNEIRLKAIDVLRLIGCAQAVIAAAEESLEPFIIKPTKKAGG